MAGRFAGALSLVLASSVLAPSSSVAAEPKAPRVFIENATSADTLKEMTTFLREKHKVDITLDEATFKNAAELWKKEVSLPPLYAVPKNLVGEILARQLGGKITVKDDRLIIIPGTQVLGSTLREPAKELTAKLDSSASVRFEEFPMIELNKGLAEHLGVSIFIDERLTEAYKEKTGTTFNPSHDGTTIRNMVNDIAKRVDGQVVLKEHDLVMIIEKPKNEQPKSKTN